MGNHTPSKEGLPRRILIVDDDALMQTLYKRLFSRHKDEFSTHFARNGKEALEVLLAADIETVLLDWDIPEISGFQLLRVLKAHPRTRSIRVVMISGRAQEADRARALEAGAEDYFTKPFEVEVLLERLRRTKPG